MAFMMTATALCERAIIIHQTGENRLKQTKVIPPVEDIRIMKQILDLDSPYTYSNAIVYFILLICLTYIALALVFLKFHKVHNTEEVTFSLCME